MRHPAMTPFSSFACGLALLFVHGSFEAGRLSGQEPTRVLESANSNSCCLPLRPEMDRFPAARPDWTRQASRQPLPRITHLDTTATTLGQRFGVGLAFGMASLLPFTLIDTDEFDFPWISLTYTASSALGIILGTHRHEGTRPLAVVLGTIVGAAPAVLASRAIDNIGVPVGIALLASFAVGVPLGGAVAHGLAGP